jgi:hypothetical protein
LKGSFFKKPVNRFTGLPITGLTSLSVLIDWSGSSITVALYDFKGNYLGVYLNTSFIPYNTGIDSSGRFLVMTTSSLDIYY